MDKIREEVQDHCESLRQAIDNRERTILQDIDKISAVTERTLSKLETDSRFILVRNNCIF